MKITTIVLLVVAGLAILFIILQAFSMSSTRKTESHQYEVLKTYSDFEIRRYEPATFSYVKMNASSYKETSRRGFSTLAGYIFGDNEANQKIAMTTPVSMELDDSITMAFMVPSEMNPEELPKPKNASISFKSEPSKVVAAIRFGGWTDDEKIETYTEQLANALEREGIPHTGKFTYLGYNPPYEMVNRRNEVIVELSGEF